MCTKIHSCEDNVLDWIAFVSQQHMSLNKCNPIQYIIFAAMNFCTYFLIMSKIFASLWASWAMKKYATDGNWWCPCTDCLTELNGPACPARFLTSSITSWVKMCWTTPKDFDPVRVERTRGAVSSSTALSSSFRPTWTVNQCTRLRRTVG